MPAQKAFQLLMRRGTAPSLSRNSSATSTSSLPSSVVSYAMSGLDTNKLLLQLLSDEDYSCKLPSFYSSSVGGHFRHILDHYQCLLDGAGTTAQLNYDLRARDTDIESDRFAAMMKNSQLKTTLQEKAASFQMDAPLTVSFMHSAQDGSSTTCTSTFSRELAFVGHHATHHQAVIKLMMTTMGTYDLKALASVGLAVSTLHSQRTM